MGIIKLVTYFFFCLFVVLVLLSLSFLPLTSSFSQDELSSYECGFEPPSLNHVPFCMKFFLMAIPFIVFDVEISFIVPTLFSSTIIFSFIIVIFVGLLFEYSYGSLSWVI